MNTTMLTLTLMHLNTPHELHWAVAINKSIFSGLSLLASHSSPCSPMGRSHLHPDPEDPAPEQPRGLAGHRDTTCCILLLTMDEPHYAEQGRADTLSLIMESLSLTQIKHPVRGALEKARWDCIVLMSLNGNCQWSWWNKYGKEITVIDWQSGSFHILYNERDLWEAAAVEAINANHMHHTCSLNYAMPCECLIHFTRLVSIQKEYSTDMLISILGEF